MKSTVSSLRRFLQKEPVQLILFAVFIATILSMIVYQRTAYKKTIDILISLNIQDIESFNVYPGVTSPTGNARRFISSAPLIQDFFQSLNDVHSYFQMQRGEPSGSSFFLEIIFDGGTIQMTCYIQSDKHRRFIGWLGKWETTGTVYYGHFQSHQLFNWYQKYNYLWLEFDK